MSGRKDAKFLKQIKSVKDTDIIKIYPNGETPYKINVKDFKESLGINNIPTSNSTSEYVEVASFDFNDVNAEMGQASFSLGLILLPINSFVEEVLVFSAVEFDIDPVRVEIVNNSGNVVFTTQLILEGYTLLQPGVNTSFQLASLDVRVLFPGMGFFAGGNAIGNATIYVKYGQI